MIPLKLEIVDFLAYKYGVLDFTKLAPTTLIIGRFKNATKSNGTGKSSLVDAITYALFNKSRVNEDKSTSNDNLVRGWVQKAASNQKAKFCQVTFEFLADNIHYRVVRGWKPRKGSGKSTLTFHRKAAGKWQPVGGDKTVSKGDINKQIEKILGLDYDVFVNSVLVKQHDVAAFANMTSSARKDVVRKILELDRYDEYESKAKKKRDSVAQQIATINTFLTEHQGNLERIAEIEKRLSLINVKMSQLESSTKVLENEANHFQDKLTSLRVDRERRAEIVKRLEDCRHGLEDKVQQKESEIVKKQKAVTKKEQLKEKYDQVVKRIEEIDLAKPNRDNLALEHSAAKVTKEKAEANLMESKVAVQTLTSEVERQTNILDRYKKLGIGECFNCLQDVTERNKTNTISRLEMELQGTQQRLTEAIKQEQIAETGLLRANSAFQLSEQNIQNYNTMLIEKRSLAKELSTVQEGIEYHKDTVDTCTKSLVDLSKDIIIYQDKYDALGKELAEYPKVDQLQYDSIQVQLQRKRIEIENNQKDKETYSSQKGQLEGSLGFYQQIKEQLADKYEQLKILEKDLLIFEELSKAFSKNGIQALILENVAGEIEEIVNKFLEKLTDSQTSIEIQTQRENKKGDNVAEVFDIIITDGFHSNPINLFSGGEVFRISLAIRIALSLVLARRSGTKIGVIFYDEAFTDLDEYGINALLDVFTELTNDFQYQLITTHTSDLKNRFNDIIIVDKTDKGSTIIQ